MQNSPANTAAKDRPRIMQVMGTGDKYGGLERHFFDLCNELSRDYHVIAVCHPAHAKRLNDAVQFESLGKYIGRRNPITLWRMASIIRRWNPDVIHTHANLASEIVAKVRGVSSARRVATVHGLKKCHRAYRSSHQIIAVSQGVAESIPYDNVTVVNNGVRMPEVSDQFDRQWLAREMNFSGDAPIALSVGRLVPEKGFDLLLEAWREIPADLVIVGEGPQRGLLEQLIERYSLQKRVRLAGFRSDVPALLHAADLKIIASRREGFPYTLIEALMSRKVIVSTDVPGATDYVPAPFLVPRLDVPALQKSIQETVADLESARQTFTSTWERAARELTLKAMAANIVQTYFPERQSACA